MTSQAVAVTRAGFDRPHSPAGDPQAQRRLCAGMGSRALDHLRASLAARTRFFDDQVTGAIAAGTRQVVVLGAGYDDRALRFRSPGVTFFELDHPATQADKRARLRVILAEDELAPGATDAAGPPAAGEPYPVLAAADFTSDDVAGVLAGSGHDPALSTLFLCEGLLVYLDQASTVRFLASVRARGRGRQRARRQPGHPRRRARFRGRRRQGERAAANGRRGAVADDPARSRAVGAAGQVRLADRARRRCRRPGHRRRAWPVAAGDRRASSLACASWTRLAAAPPARARGCSGRPTSGRSRPGWVPGRRSGSARTSSSTRGRSGGSSRWPACGQPTSSSRSGPGLGSLTLGLLEAARRVVAVEVDPVLAAELPGDRGRPGRRAGRPARRRDRGRAEHAGPARRAAGRPGREPALQRGRPGPAAPARDDAVDQPRAGHGPG